MLKKINRLLQDRDFVNVATCDLSNRPNAAPKFFLKLEDNTMYLIDYTRGRTFDNLQINPLASLSFTDLDSLHGYQLNGEAEIITAGDMYDRICEELVQREIDLSTKRIIEGVTREKGHGNFEVALPDKFVVFKIAIKEVVEIGPAGGLKRETI